MIQDTHVIYSLQYPKRRKIKLEGIGLLQVRDGK